MKTATAIALVFLCIFGCFGCSSDKSTDGTINFYYCTNDVSYNDINGVIAPESRDAEQTDDLALLLNQYLQGPISNEFQNPFPAGTTIEAFDSDETTVYITMSEPFGQLSELDLTLACACLCRTVFDLTEQQSVQIQCSNTLLGGNPSITMTESSLLWADTAETVASTNP